VVIGVRSWELHIPGAHSLKEKRSVVKGLKDRLHNQFNVSVAETAHHELWQRAELTACVVATERRQAESVLSAVDAFVQAGAAWRVVDSVGYVR
jgi:uncharacterized protein YlxP (DUF503 family)